MSEINLNSSNFDEQVTNTDKLVLMQLGVVHVKWYLQLFRK